MGSTFLKENLNMEDLKNQEMEQQEHSTNEDIKNLNDEDNQDLEQTNKIEKSYSEDEVNEIVQRRLARERKRLNKLLDPDEFNEELIKRERAISLREMKADAKDILNVDNIPLAFIELIDFEDKETMNKSLETIKKIKDEYIEPWVRNEINKRFAGKTPNISNSNIKSDPLEKAFKL